MKGTILMEFDGASTKIKVAVKGVGTAEKCSAVDNLLSALEATGTERLLILAALASNTKVDDKEEDKDEGRCFRN